jgi:hypothetical protein
MNIWQRIKSVFKRREEVEDDLILETFAPEVDLLDVLELQLSLLSTLSECEFNALYDEGQEDKIRCVTDSYKVIAATQRALLKQIKSL